MQHKYKNFIRKHISYPNHADLITKVFSILRYSCMKFLSTLSVYTKRYVSTPIQNIKNVACITK